MNNSYTLVISRSLDILLCSWIWRNYDITISSMTGLALKSKSPPKWAVYLGWVLNHIQANHCNLAIAADIERATSALAILSGQ